ncbi:hypothetical protein CCUS01_12036 [Colletotrichum cuscutae]|uniref:Uncharacterized protein n=1 Tax=Colletotrichum cuscutae TaxID=1209917 RepID=A0AAI9XFC3_9PEZI|nr:hypothetical protein CCUS01_12036 [Colletotrichum cuscutae]
MLATPAPRLRERFLHGWAVDERGGERERWEMG